MTVPASVLKVRKAAALALAVPGVSFVVYQMDWPPILVGWRDRLAPSGEVWRHACPRRFRAELLRDPTGGSALVGPMLGVTGADVRVEIATSSSTTIDDVGMFTIHGARRTATGFVVASDVRVPAVDEATFRQPRRGPPRSSVSAAIDVDLGTQVVAWWYRSDDVDEEECARQVAIDALVTASVDELLLFSTD